MRDGAGTGLMRSRQARATVHRPSHSRLESLSAAKSIQTRRPGPIEASVRPRPGRRLRTILWRDLSAESHAQSSCLSSLGPLLIKRSCFRMLMRLPIHARLLAPNATSRVAEICSIRLGKCGGMGSATRDRA